jgi:Kef-type K+ transport system membrane component KefB
MIGFALLRAGAAVALGAAHFLRVPAIPLLLVAGSVLGFTGVIPPDLLQDAIVLGVTFLVFFAGLELNPAKVGEQRRAALWVGVVQFAVLGATGLAVALALGHGITPALYLALAMTASSTLVVVRLLQSRQQLFEPFGRLVLGVLLLQDLAIILLIPVVTRMPDGGMAVAQGLLAAVALTGAALLFARLGGPRLALRFRDDEEALLLVILGVLFMFIGGAAFLGLPIIAGAFLAGLALSPFPTSMIVRGPVLSLSDFFLALFFTALGGLVARPDLLALGQSLVFVVVLIVVTPVVVTVTAERAGLSTRPAVESGLLLAQASEFSLVVGLWGLVAGQITTDVFTIVALVTVITMLITPFLGTDAVTWRLMRLHPLRGRPAITDPPSDHILLLGCGDSGMPLLETMIAAGHEVVVVDDDAAIIDRLQDGDIPCVRGDGSDRDVLERVGVTRARLIISTIRRAADNETVLSAGAGIPTVVRVFDDAAAERIRSLGGIPIVYADAAAEEFLRWFSTAGALLTDRGSRRPPPDPEVDQKTLQ